MKKANGAFHEEANAILAERMNQFEHLTAITPTVHTRRKDLQFYLNKRNRAKIVIFQDTRELEPGEAPFADYVDWLENQDAGDYETNYKEPFVSNPDKLADTYQAVPIREDAYTGVEIHSARKIIANAHKFLSPQEFLVFQMKFVEGLTPSEIAGRMNISYHTVQTYITRITPKLRTAYEEAV